MGYYLPDMRIVVNQLKYLGLTFAGISQRVKYQNVIADVCEKDRLTNVAVLHANK
jgi:hypothetical protein